MHNPYITRLYSKIKYIVCIKNVIYILHSNVMRLSVLKNALSISNLNPDFDKFK